MRAYRYILFLLLSSFIPLGGYSQHVLNGSFENNTLPPCGHLNYYNYAQYNIEVPNTYYYNGVSFDILQIGCLYPTTTNNYISDEGQWFVRLQGDSAQKRSDSISFKLSNPININQVYVIRFALCSNTRLALSKDSVLVGISASNIHNEQIIGGYKPMDSTKYRSYAIGFKSEKPNQYIHFGMANGRQHSLSLLDNVRLDTCVSLLGTRTITTIECNPFPMTIKPKISGSKYYWNYADTTQQITAYVPDWYIAYIYDSVGCVAIDSIHVIADTSTLHMLNHDTSFCIGSSINLSSTSPTSSSFLWNTGDTLPSIHTSLAANFVCISTLGACTTIDSFNVNTIIPPSLPLASDTTFCFGDSVLINASSSFYNNYSWSTGDTLASIYASSQQHLIVTASNPTCRITDSIQVHVKNITPLQLPSDTTLCSGNSLLIDAFNLDYQKYIWNNGDTNSFIHINTADTFWVKASNQYCSIIDSVITFIQFPDSLKLVKDSNICFNQNITINAANPLYTKYLWNTGITIPQITINTPGLYKVTATNGICSTMDSIDVHLLPSPQLHLPRDTSVCFDQLKSILLDAGVWKTYAWYPTGEHTQTINATYPEMYRVVVTDSFNCVGTDTALVEEECASDVFIPNIFTPNKDGVNDILLVRGYGIHSIQLFIYNRWGEIVFSTNSLTQGWDGSINGKFAPDGVYLYVVNYTLNKSNMQLTKTGNVTLLR